MSGLALKDPANLLGGGHCAAQTSASLCQNIQHEESEEANMSLGSQFHLGGVERAQWRGMAHILAARKQRECLCLRPLSLVAFYSMQTPAYAMVTPYIQIVFPLCLILSRNILIDTQTCDVLIS